MQALEWAPDETVGKNEKFGPYRQSENIFTKNMLTS
jgi:hypothetical protein